MLHIVIEPNEIETNTQQDEKIEIEEDKGNNNNSEKNIDNDESNTIDDIF